MVKSWLFGVKMEVYDPYALFEVDGKSVRLKDNSECLESICNKDRDIDIFSIKDDLYEFKLCVEKNLFLYEKHNKNNLFYCYLINKDIEVKSLVGYFIDKDQFLQNNEIKLFCYGIFGYLTLNKNKEHAKNSNKLQYSQFIQELSKILYNNGIYAQFQKIYDKQNFKLLCSGNKSKFKTKVLQFGSTRSILLNANTDKFILFKYISPQYKKLESEAIKLELEYLSEIGNAVSKILNRDKNIFLGDCDVANFKDKLLVKSRLVKGKFKNLFEEGATGALHVHEMEIADCID